MKYLTSGNPIVDAMGEINISGNVTPQIWYKTILRENGKPYLLAIATLSDIVYCYENIFTIYIITHFNTCVRAGAVCKGGKCKR